MKYRVWFTERFTGFEIFQDVEAENGLEARQKAEKELKQKNPNLQLIYRYTWRI